jgi:hypothetical protein
MEELLPQLPDDEIGSRVNKEDLAGPPPPFCIPSTERACHRVPAGVCCL